MPTTACRLKRLRIALGDAMGCRTISLRTSDFLRGFRVMSRYGMLSRSASARLRAESR
jgi:hypothetical protein